MKSIFYLAFLFIPFWTFESIAQGGHPNPGPGPASEKQSGSTYEYTKTLQAPFFGLNTKNISDGNFMEDINVLTTGWKRTHARIYRYPGGTFGNSFDWHTGTTIIGGRPPEVDPPVQPADVAKNLPPNTEILWMANIRVPTPATGYDWRSMTREELLSQEVLEAKIQDILEGLQSFKNNGREVKYIELGNEFYFSKDEGLGEIHGAGGDNPASDFQGDHFPYDKNPQEYINQMAQLAKSVKEIFPEIKIAVIKQKMEAGNQANWNTVIDEAFRNNNDLKNNVDAVVYHWYQNEKWYTDQPGALPTITDISSSRNALGFAFDYFAFKENNDLENVPEEKDVWVTEGDIKDPSTEGTWLEAIREALVNMHYVLMPRVTMYTPQIFQPKYIDFKTLGPTLKGLGIDMIYAAAGDMQNAERLELGGNLFYSEYGGPYPALNGIRFSDESRVRMVLINVSEKTCQNINVAQWAGDQDLTQLERYSTAPWEPEYEQRWNRSPNLESLTLQPFSITLLATEELAEVLIEDELWVVNPNSGFPERKVSLYDFGETQPGEELNAILHIKNKGTNTLQLVQDPVSVGSGSPFSIEQPGNLLIPPGEKVAFSIRFVPLVSGQFEEEIEIKTTGNLHYRFKIRGKACSFCNADFEKGHDVEWSFQTTGNLEAAYDRTSTWNTASGQVSGRIRVMDGTTGNYDDAALGTPLIPLEQPADKLKIRIEAKSLPADAAIQLSVLYFDTHQNEVGRHISESLPLDPSYRFIEFTGNKIPDGSAYYQLVVGCGNQPGDYYFDNLEIIPVDEVNTQHGNFVSDFRIYVSNRKLIIESGGLSEPGEISLFTLAGQPVLRVNVPATSQTQRIPLPADLIPGIYIVHIRPDRPGYPERVQKVFIW